MHLIKVDLIFLCQILFTAPARSLVVKADLEKVFYSLSFRGQTLLMASFELTTPNILNMARILSQGYFPKEGFFDVYEHYDFSSLRIEQFITKIFPSRYLHPIFFPTTAYEKYPLLRNAIIEAPFQEYSPKVVVLSDEASELSMKELSPLLFVISKDPLRSIGTPNVVSIAWKYEIFKPCVYTTNLNVKMVKTKLEFACNPDLVYIDSLILLSRNLRLVHEYITPSKDLESLVQMFLSSSNWNIYYSKILGFIATSIVDEVDYHYNLSIWHGKLLIQTIQIYSVDNDRLVTLIFDFLSEYNIQRIPLFVIQELLLRITEERIKLPETLNTKQYQLLELLDSICPDYPGFWGGTEKYSFRYIPRLNSGRIIHFPNDVMLMDEAVSFFADGTLSRDDPVLVDPTFPISITLQNGKTRIICKRLEYFLEALTSYIIFQSGAIFGKEYGMDLNADYEGNSDIWTCIARLIVYNLIYRNTTGFRFSQNVWDNIFLRNNSIFIPNKETHNARKAIRKISAQLMLLDIEEYFPRTVLFKDLQTIIT